MFLPPAISAVKVVPSYVCHRGCSYCYNKKLGQVGSGNERAIMDALDIVLNSAPRTLQVEVIGGEPLEGSTASVTKRILERVRVHDKCRATALSTSIYSRVLLEVAPHLDNLFLSIDIPNGRHNRKPLNRERLKYTASRMTAMGVSMTVCAVLFGNESSDDILEFIETLEECGVQSIGFSYECASVLSEARVARYVDQLHFLFELRLALAGRLAIHGATLRALELYVGGRRMSAACECGVTAVLIEPSGNVSAGICVNHAYGPNDLADVAHAIAARTRALVNQEPCKSCRLWDCCQGGCFFSQSPTFNASGFSRDETGCAIMLGVAHTIDEEVACADSSAA